MFIIIGYFSFKIVYYGVIQTINDDVLSARFGTAVQAFDIVFFGGTLFIFRSRRWPPFFTIGINDLQNVNYNLCLINFLCIGRVRSE